MSPLQVYDTVDRDGFCSLGFGRQKQPAWIRRINAHQLFPSKYSVQNMSLSFLTLLSYYASGRGFFWALVFEHTSSPLTLKEHLGIEAFYSLIVLVWFAEAGCIGFPEKHGENTKGPNWAR